MQKPTNEDWIYAAAIIDGEGSIGLAKVSNYNRKREKYFAYSPFVCVGNTNKVLTDWLLATFGGKVKYQKRKNAWKDFYFWDMRGRDEIVWFLKNIISHLKLKQNQASLLIRYFDKWHVNDPVWREKFHAEFSKLNRKGKPVETNTQDSPEDDMEMKIESELLGD